MQRLFVTGTNTEVGKTYVTSLLAKRFANNGRSVGVYKPVASGCIERNGELISEDAEQLWLGAGKPLTLSDVTPQKFLAPLAPNVAAAQEGKRVDPALLRSGLDVWNGFDVTLVEGVGGLMSPISDEDLVIDLAAEFGDPLVIVAANELGCISQTLLTIDCARSRGLPIGGVILNSAREDQDESCASNLEQLTKWTNEPIVAVVKWNDTSIDWLPD